MLTLSQIEPRAPISSAPFIISRPGSYYLTTNLTVSSGNAITINTNDVTLDLNGFTISSTAASATGVAILLNTGTNAGLSDIQISNGHISSGVTNNNGVFSGSGFASGIDLPANAAQPTYNSIVRYVTVTGCLNDGVILGNGEGTLIEDCVVQNCGQYGIDAFVVRSCQANFCGTDGVVGYTIDHCFGFTVAPGGRAIYAQNQAVDCNAISDASGAVAIWGGNEAINCCGNCENGGGGYGVTAGLIVNCYGYGLSGSTGLSGNIGIGSVGTGTGTGEVFNYKYNMP